MLHINCYYIFICGCIMYMICMFNLCIYKLYACIMYIKLYIMVYMGHGCIYYACFSILYGCILYNVYGMYPILHVYYIHIIHIIIIII